MTHSLLVERFGRIARDRPDHPCIVCLPGSHTETCATVWSQYRQFSAALHAAGLGPGAPLGLLSGNRSITIPLLLACLDRGLPAMMFDEATPMDEVNRAAARFRLAALVAPANVEAQSGNLSLGQGLILRRLAEQGRADLRDAAILKLTSGSTGSPKAVCVTEGNLLSDIEHIVCTMGIGHDDVQLGCIPISHSYGLGSLVGPLLTQGTTLVLRSPGMPRSFVEDVRRTGVSVFPGTPSMYEFILNRLAPSALPDTIRLCISAGAPLEPASARSFLSTFGLKIHAFYGSSETGGITYDDSSGVDEAGSVGRPLHGVSVSIAGAQGCLPTESGVVQVSSPAVAAGYVDSGEQGGGFRGNCFQTGDLGHLTSDGRLVLEGRVSSFVNVGGLKVHPEEVATVLRGMPDIRDAHVLGVACRWKGEKLLALVVTCSGAVLPIAAIQEFCARRLSGYKIPSEVVCVPEIPRDSRGKIDRRWLQST